jgi:hypothetical protein
VWAPDLAEHAEKEAGVGPSEPAAAAEPDSGDADIADAALLETGGASRQVEGWLDDLRHRHR